MSDINALNTQTQATTSPVGTVVNPNGTTASASTSSSLNKNDFLNLLVAQLKYQDPSQPADSSQIMTQTAQFSEVEALQNMEKGQTQMLNASQSVAATNMLGQTITYGDAGSGADVRGVVTGVKLGTDGPVLKIGNTEVPLASVKEVTKT